MGLLDAKKKAQARKGGALGKLKAKSNGKAPAGALKKGALGKVRQQRLLSVEGDFKDNGLVYHNAHFQGRTASGRPYGVVDVSNGDKTFTFHNRFGSWFHDVDEGKMKEAKSFEITARLQARFDKELKLQGIKTAAELAEEERKKAEAQKKRLAKLQADQKAKAKPKPSIKGAKGKGKKK